MSIQSEITRINNSVSLAYDEALVMGATIPAIRNVENLASTITSMFLTIDDSEGNRILDDLDRALRGHITA